MREWKSYYSSNTSFIDPYMTIAISGITDNVIHTVENVKYAPVQINSMYSNPVYHGTKSFYISLGEQKSNKTINSSPVNIKP